MVGNRQAREKVEGNECGMRVAGIVWGTCTYVRTRSGLICIMFSGAAEGSKGPTTVRFRS